MRFLYRYRARIVRYVDGDTVDAEVDLGFRVFSRVRFRLLDVDTPERGEPGFREATEKLRELVQAGEDAEGFVEIKSRKTGKYGRWLATIYGPEGDDVRSVNERLAKWLSESGFEKGA